MDEHDDAEWEMSEAEFDERMEAGAPAQIVATRGERDAANGLPGGGSFVTVASSYGTLTTLQPFGPGSLAAHRAEAQPA